MSLNESSVIPNRDQVASPDVIECHDAARNSSAENLVITNRIEPILRTVGKVALLPIKFHNKLIRKVWNYHKGAAVALVAAEVFGIAKGLAYTDEPSEEMVKSCNDAGHQMIQLGGNNLVENSAQTIADAPGRLLDKITEGFGSSTYIGYKRSTQAAANEVQTNAGYSISPERLAQANPDLFINDEGKIRGDPTVFGAACLNVPGPIIYGFSEADGSTSIEEYIEQYLLTPRQFAALNPGLPKEKDFEPPAGTVIKWTEDYNPKLVLSELTEDSLVDVIKGKGKQAKAKELVEANSFALIQSENIEENDIAYLPLRLTHFHTENGIKATDIIKEYAHNYVQLPRSQSIEPVPDSRRINAVTTTQRLEKRLVIEHLKQLGPEWRNRAEAMRFFMDHGFTDYQAAGIIGNFQIESGSPTLPAYQKQFGGGPGRGLAQWEAGARFEDLKQFAHRKGTVWHDFDTQLNFVMHEFATTEKRAYRKLKATEGVRQATASVLNDYERPAARIVGPRLDAAEEILDAYRRGLTTQLGNA